MNIQAAVQGLEMIIEGFIASLPTIILAALVFLLTYVGARLERRTVKPIVDREDKVLTHINGALTEAGIDMPFPTNRSSSTIKWKPPKENRAYHREGWPADPDGNPPPCHLSGTLGPLTKTIGGT